MLNDSFIHLIFRQGRDNEKSILSGKAVRLVVVTVKKRVAVFLRIYIVLNETLTLIY